MKELVVCKFNGCNQVFNDPRILPCGKRTCAAHIEAMLVKTDDDKKMIKCHFCQRTHTFPDNDRQQFPVDEYMPQLLNIRHSFEHDAAKKSFTELTLLIEQLATLDEERYVIDYFGQVKRDVVLEKEINRQTLVAHYQQLVDHVQERQAKCLQTLTSNPAVKSELSDIKKAIIGYGSELKADNMDFILKTLDGDGHTWKEIQSKCNSLLNKTKSLGERLKERLVGDQTIQFVPSSSNIQPKSTCGRLSTSHQCCRAVATSATTLGVDNLPSTKSVLFWLFFYFVLFLFGGASDSRDNAQTTTTIVYKPCSCRTRLAQLDSMQDDLANLCDLRGKELTLIYRASRDGFQASSFHAKCDEQPRTLTVIKTTKGYIFGGYTAVAWDSVSLMKGDRNAFIFSLVNAHSAPMLMPVKDDDVRFNIWCLYSYGPSFGRFRCNDIFISDNSNSNTESFSYLGCSFDFTLYNFGTAEAQSFLDNSPYFQTSEIEVFKIN